MINSKRINAICNCVDKPVVAEVGADHGHITHTLFKQNKIKKAYLTDISKKCLDKAVRNFSSSPYQTQVKFLVGDGLNALSEEEILSPHFLTPLQNKFVPNDNMQIIIAGMGGLEIIKILSSNQSEKFTHFVLQPQRNAVELRKFLQDNNYKILSDVMVKEGKIFYNVIKAQKTDGKYTLTEEELLYGKTNLTQPNTDFVEYVKFELTKLKEISKVKKVEEIENKIFSLQKLFVQINKGE